MNQQRHITLQQLRREEADLFRQLIAEAEHKIPSRRTNCLEDVLCCLWGQCWLASDFRPPPTNVVVGSAISTPLGEDLNNHVTDLATLVTTASSLCSLLAVPFDKSGLHQATERHGGGNTAPRRGNATGPTSDRVATSPLSLNDLDRDCRGRKALQNQETPPKPGRPHEIAVRFARGFLEDQNGVKHSSE
jgi:hypothetical protein